MELKFVILSQKQLETVISDFLFKAMNGTGADFVELMYKGQMFH
jgi:hypothetical protein